MKKPYGKNRLDLFGNQKKAASLGAGSNGESQESGPDGRQGPGQVNQGKGFTFVVSPVVSIHRILSKGINDLILFMERQEGSWKLS